MSREEEIEQQAKSLYYHFCIRETCEGEDNCTNCLHGKVIEPLVTMAKWADKHPREGLVDVEKVCNWISVYFEKSIDKITMDYILAMFRKAMED